MFFCLQNNREFLFCINGKEPTIVKLIRIFIIGFGLLYYREVLWIEADTSLPAQRVIRVLQCLEECRGLPHMIRVDNGPEFISFKLDAWCRERKITLVFIQPGKPMQNAFIERCNGNIRKELLNAYIFKTLDEVRQKTLEWKKDYNEHRPHAALNYRTPMDLLTKNKQ